MRRVVDGVVDSGGHPVRDAIGWAPDAACSHRVVVSNDLITRMTLFIDHSRSLCTCRPGESTQRLRVRDAGLGPIVHDPSRGTDRADDA